jgi:hypothetical protein
MAVADMKSAGCKNRSEKSQTKAEKERKRKKNGSRKGNGRKLKREISTKD